VMKTPLGTEVDLGPGHIVLDGVPAPAKGAQDPLPRRRGFPGTISVKFSVDVNGWPRYLMSYKYCRKFEPPESGAQALQTTDRQKDDRQTDER